jgi:hypothetical protein
MRMGQVEYFKTNESGWTKFIFMNWLFYLLGLPDFARQAGQARIRIVIG